MTETPQHEFSFDEEEVIIGLSESLYRFAIMTGVVGLALVGLGIAVTSRGAYGNSLAGPSIIVMGVLAMVGALLFTNPRATFDEIITTQGNDITKLMQGLASLSNAHGLFRLVVAGVALARVAAFFLARIY